MELSEVTFVYVEIKGLFFNPANIAEGGFFARPSLAVKRLGRWRWMVSFTLTNEDERLFALIPAQLPRKDKVLMMLQSEAGVFTKVNLIAYGQHKDIQQELKKWRNQ